MEIWFSEKINSIIRRLEYDLFLTEKMRAFLEDKLSKLLEMREIYREHQRPKEK